MKIKGNVLFIKRRRRIRERELIVEQRRDIPNRNSGVGDHQGHGILRQYGSINAPDRDAGGGIINDTVALQVIGQVRQEGVGGLR